jgi:hypothetical protein
VAIHPADTTLITNEQSKHDSASPSNIEDGVASEESPHSNVCEESHAEEAAEMRYPKTQPPNTVLSLEYALPTTTQMPQMP